LDFDGVLAHGLKAKIKYAKEWFGVDLSFDQTKEAGFNALMKRLGKNANYRSLMDPLNEQHLLEYEVPDDCIEALMRLYSQKCRFAVITSRNDHDYQYAVQFIQKKFGDLIQYIHNTRNEPKGLFAKRLKVRVHVDDDLSKLMELAELPIELIYYRQPENEGIDIPAALSVRINEAFSFDEIEVIIARMQTLHKAICKKEKIDNNWTNAWQIYTVLHSLSEKEKKELLRQ
jgi:hypothetical protein